MTLLAVAGWDRLTGTQVALAGSTVAFVTAFVSLIVGQVNERRRARQALNVERLRIDASREVEDRRIAAGAEADTRRWVRDELKAGLATVFAGVDALLDVWEHAALARDIWLDGLRADHPDPPSPATHELERAATDAWDFACHRWEQLDATLTGLGLVGSASLVEAANDLDRSFESLRHHLRPPSPVDDNARVFRDDANIVRSARWVLVEAARQELGLGRLEPGLPGGLGGA